MSQMLQHVLYFGAWFLALVVLMSLIEHWAHSRLMHKKPRNFLTQKSPARWKMFDRHAIVHHRQYFKSFHDDPVPHGEDRGIQLNVWEGLIESLPVSAVLALFSFTGAMLFPVVVCLHHITWNQIHMEMHKPEGRFFAGWRLYKHLARHHYLHHRYPDKNFNVALPVGDLLFGTMAKASADDWRAMEKEGIA
jgi:hypothetical protein